jgi:hypothetical protein
LQITTEFSFALGTECKTGEGLAAQFHYSGSQPLRGYVVRLALSDSETGKVQQQQMLEEIRGPHEPMIASGAEWTRAVCTVPIKLIGNQTTVTAKIDALKFADGSIWGPAALPESHQMIGALDGIDFLEKTTELQRFVTPILPEQGPFPTEGIESQTIGPLRIESGLWRDEDGQEMLAAAVTNDSPTPIRAYLFVTTFFDPTTGTRIRRASTKELETHGNPADYLAPGATWIADPRKFSLLGDGSLASYKITVDLVVFADGTTFGPKKSAESDEVLGMIRGIDDAKRLNQAYPENKGH